MGIDCDVSAYCDGCHSHIYDDRVYCEGCAGDTDPSDIEFEAKSLAVELVKEWFDDNALILTKEQYAFGQVMYESVRRGQLPVFS